MNAPTPSPIVPPVSVAASRRLFRLGVGAVVAAAAYFLYSTPLTDPVQIALGLAILVLAALPALRWAREASFVEPAPV